jgi:uncharacterized delta-60 repeat protein
VAVALVCLGPVAAPASAAPGDLDPSFDGDGKVFTNAEPTAPADRAQGVALQPDGKIVAVGQSIGNVRSQLVRYNADGSLDQSFGDGGKVTIPENLRFQANEVVLQRDGKLVVAGGGYDEAEGLSGLAVVRYNANGTLDTGFGGGDGIVVTHVPPPDPEAEQDTEAFDVAIQGDGKIVAAGIATAVSYGSASHAAAITRFSADGERDETFGDGGLQYTGMGVNSNYRDFQRDLGLVLQPDGKSVIATAGFPGADPDFLVARFTANGQPDPSFDDDGLLLTNIRTFPEGGGPFPEGGGSGDIAEDIALQPDGKLVVVGYSGRTGFNDDTQREFALARYNADGSLDSSFDGDGRVLSDAGGADMAQAVALQRDGKIVVGGSSQTEFVDSLGRFFRGDFVLFRYGSNGALDPGFGQGGKVTTSFGPNVDQVEDLAIQPDGRIVAAGFTFDEEAPGGDFALARYEGEPPAAGGGGGGGGNSPPPPTGGNPPPPPQGKGCVNSAGVRVLGRTNSGGRVFQGSKGSDRICGTSRGDVITGNGGKDVISGFGGADRINGGSGSDRINGGSGKDRISGSSGNDVISGGSGNDRINGNSGRDRINGNSGNDRLAGASGNDVISGSSGKDVISGGSGNDRLSGNSGNDRLNGDSGNDRISGGSGNDRLSGGSGRDRLNGGPGRDSGRQ